VEKFNVQLIAKPWKEFHTECSWFSIDLVINGCQLMSFLCILDWVVSYQLSEIGRAINVSVKIVATKAETKNVVATCNAIWRRLKPFGINHQ
jgi:hypothetical protein